jgi:hypothetical protein
MLDRAGYLERDQAFGAPRQVDVVHRDRLLRRLTNGEDLEAVRELSFELESRDSERFALGLDFAGFGCADLGDVFHRSSLQHRRLPPPTDDLGDAGSSVRPCYAALGRFRPRPECASSSLPGSSTIPSRICRVWTRV